MPRLHSGGFSRADAAFTAGLAQLHGRIGLAGVDAEQVNRLVRMSESPTANGVVPPGHFAALCRLWIETETQRGRDPVPLVAELMAKAFEGRLPFVFAQQLLEDWAAKWWTRTNLARLRVMLCDRAFEAGFEVQSLLDAGQNAPAAGGGAGHARAAAPGGAAAAVVAAADAAVGPPGRRADGARAGDRSDAGRAAGRTAATCCCTARRDVPGRRRGQDADGGGDPAIDAGRVAARGAVPHPAARGRRAACGRAAAR